MFDAAVHLEQRPAGQVWLEEDAPAGDAGDRDHGDHGVVNGNGGHDKGCSENSGTSLEIGGGCDHDHDQSATGEDVPGAPEEEAGDAVPPDVVTPCTLSCNSSLNGGSGTGAIPDRATTPVVNAWIMRSEREDALSTVDPHDFLALAA